MQEVIKQKVSFQRDDLKLVGYLFTPAHFDEQRKYPALICQGSVSSVKEMMSDNYARLLAPEGFVVLGFDYASYGESEGLPRQNENVESKLKVKYAPELEKRIRPHLLNKRLVKSR